MRRVAAVAFLVTAIVFGALNSARGQPYTNYVAPVTPPPAHPVFTLFGGVVAGSIATAAVAPIVGTIVLGRELSFNEAYRLTFGSFLGPLGWLIADQLAPPNPGGGSQPPQGPRNQQTNNNTNTNNNTGQSHNISIPRLGETGFVVDEVLVEFGPGASPQDIVNFDAALQVTPLETQTFATTGRTLRRLRIIGGNSVRNTLIAMQPFGQILAAQVNHYYRGMQLQPPAAPAEAAEPAPNPEQYVVPKLHLMEAHRITSGDDVIVAVVDSKIDTQHPDLAGVFLDSYDALETPNAPSHAHGTGMAGAIAAHTKLMGVAPKVRLLAVRAFSGEQDGAQGTTYNILKGVEWAVGKGARIINMSFAGPPDPMLHNLMANVHSRGVVLIAAVGNAGPKSPPLFPAAEPDVIGVTATDADDKLLAVANRGPQVAVAAPGVEILEPGPEGTYQVTTGTSVAAAHVSGVAALLLARKPDLKPDEVRALLVRSARHIPGNKRDVGAGVVDALRAIDAINTN